MSLWACSRCLPKSIVRGYWINFPILRIELVNLLSWKVTTLDTVSKMNLFLALERTLHFSQRYLLAPSNFSVAKKLPMPSRSEFDRWHSYLFIQILYNIEVVVALWRYRLESASEAFNACFHESSKYLEYFCLFDGDLVCCSIFSQLSRLTLLHSFNKISQELMRVFLLSKFKLDNSISTFLKIVLRWLIILFGENLLLPRVFV
jgi:hypothetical protein